MTVIEKVLLLQAVDLFASVTVEQLSFLAAIAEEETIEADKVLYREKDPPDGLYVVVSGDIRISRGGETIEQIGPNTPFGVWALFDDQPRLTQATSTTETCLLFVPREEFYDVLSDHVDIVQGIFKQLVRRMRRLATVLEKE